MTQNKRLGLALGGGAALGVAHVGVVQVLAEAGVRVDAVAGTSAGAIVGLCLAAGLSADQMTTGVMQRFNWGRVARPAWPRRGFISFAPLERFLVRELGDLTFADLSLPFTCIAADPLTGRSHAFTSGHVAPRVRASCSVPPIVQPVEIEGRLYVDGVIANNLPITAARALGVECVLAVNLLGPPRALPTGYLAYSQTILGQVLVQAGEDPHSADILVEPDLIGFDLLRLRRRALIERGRAAMTAKLPELLALLQ